MILSLFWYVIAPLFEISGCFAFWAWQKSGRSAAWTLPGVLSLITFALALTQIPQSAAGRTYAVYGGVYIAASIRWLWAVEKTRPDVWDIGGGSVCLIGAAIIFLAPRNA